MSFIPPFNFITQEAYFMCENVYVGCSDGKVKKGAVEVSCWVEGV